MTITHDAFRIAGAAVRHETTPIKHLVRTSFGVMRERHALFLMLKSETGQVGVGESWINFPRWAYIDRTAAFEQAIIPWLEDRAIENVAETLTELYQNLIGGARQSGTVGPLLSALCAVELALWDLAAQMMDRPLASLLFDESQPQGAGIREWHQ